MEAAFAIAAARDRSLQLLLMKNDREVVKLAWCLAYMDGVTTAYQHLQNVMDEGKS